MIPSREGTHRLRNFIAIISLFSGIITASIWIVNSKAVWKHVLSLVNVRGNWSAGLKDFELDPMDMSLSVDGLSLKNKIKNRSASIDRIRFRITPLGFLRGKIIFEDLSITGVKLSFPPTDKTTKREHRRLDISKLILLRNIIIDEGSINQLSASLGKNSEISTDEIRFSLRSGILSDTELKIRTDGLLVSKSGENKISAGMLNLDTSTELSKWNSTFPYFNDLSGSLKMRDVNAEGLMIEEVLAKAAYRDYIAGLKELSMDIGGRKLIGSLMADFHKETFDININIENPVPVPHIVKPLQTINTAGAVSGNISLSGTGFIPSSTRGDAQVRITHAFDTSAANPITVSTAVSWSGGIFKLSNSRVSAGDNLILLSGIVDIKSKLIDLEGKAERFPIEFIFDKFRNPHLSKIFGASDITGTFRGWGKDFQAHLTGTSYDGGWNNIISPLIKTELDATYNKLTLDFSLLSGDRKSGTSHVEVAFGPKTKGLPRHKDIKVEAKLDKHPLADTLATYGITGYGTGSLKITGPSQSFKGEAKAQIRNGSWKNINFERASAKIDISRRKLLFHDLDLAILRVPTDTSGEITADISPGQIHFYGSPMPDFNFDIHYMSGAKRWRIKEISWHKDDKDQNAVATGTISGDGPIDMKVKGRADLKIFKPLLTIIRSGNGPIDIDLSIKGRSSDPQFFGDIKFNKNYLTLRNVQLVLENLDGGLKFSGHKVNFDNVVATSVDGSLSLKGWFEHAQLKPKFADITLAGNAMRYRTKDKEFNIEFEGNMSLKGAFPQPSLSGNIFIIDGKYTRDFNIIGQLTKNRSETPPPKKGGIDDMFDPKLSLHIQNTGDLEIKNNVGEVYLSANIDVTGTRKKPIVSGSITSNEGKIDYLGLLFDITKGFIEFRANYEKPYIELHGDRELGVYNISIVLHGQTDNLSLDLSATSPAGPLEKRDVISLILFGMTEDERDYYTRNQRGDMTTSLVAKSLTSVVERPVTRYTHLDVFRLEASDPEKSHVSRLYVGKQVSDRLSINFATDINTDEAEQTVIAEYLLTDNLLIRGSRSTDQKSEFSGLLRFRMR